MIELILLIVLIAASLYGVLLIRSFEYMSVTELKRQARAGNDDAKKVYPVRIYGMQLWIFLWTIMGFLTSSIILLMHGIFGSFWTIVINVPFILIMHAILPWSRRPKPSLHMAAIVSPYIERILRFLFPILRWFERWVGRWIQPEPMLLIQSKDELLEILRHNADEFDNIHKDELKIAESALTFGDKLIGDYMTPLNTVKFIANSELLAPVLLGELHDSGHSRFPVYEGNNQHIVGTLYLKDATKPKIPKTANELMRPDVYYINEQSTLDLALNAFLKTKHHLFIVVNEFEDVVGVLSVEDVLEQIIGQPIQDEFDKFDDLRAVAAKHASKKHAETVGTYV
jgi:CBS domain containing-hemolysin-like protein